MKVIVTGCTGQIGSAVLLHCLENPAVSHIYALSRRPLSVDFTKLAVSFVGSGNINSKLTSIIHEDFSSYPDALLDQLAGADTCIWSLGVIPRKGAGCTRDLPSRRHHFHTERGAGLRREASAAIKARAQVQICFRERRWSGERPKQANVAPPRSAAFQGETVPFCSL
jgi:hypothetical protein